ncbi:hypothetical protein F383_08517 [Gossypium arboreum]|uniref:Uncharacterized protein n=1 Tax=Gossypium arboreum TaxID=29729 RepID=A0A0B0P827_GOSAR|nr:hypothetical protein F383_18354 [Gossypium arboreum]KHG20274.1 hypothetical protein F383_08517 [Gossypium arboreum]
MAQLNVSAKRGDSMHKSHFEPKCVGPAPNGPLWGSHNGRSSTLLCLRIRRRSRREPSLTWRGGVAHDAKEWVTCCAWRPS